MMGPAIGCTPAPPGDPPDAGRTLLIFHNDSGPMCREALAWLEVMRSVHPTLVVEEHLTTSPAGLALFEQMRAQYTASRGVSTGFGYLPVIFFEGQAFSGFNDEVKQALTELMNAPPASP